MRYYVFNIRSNWFVIAFLRSSDWIKEFRLFHSSLHSYTKKNCFNQTMIQSRLTETVLADGVLNGLKIGRTERPMRRLKQQPMPNRSRSLLLHNLFTLSSVFTSHRAHRRRAKNIFMEKNTKNHRRICLDYRKPLFFLLLIFSSVHFGYFICARCRCLAHSLKVLNPFSNTNQTEFFFMRFIRQMQA